MNKNELKHILENNFLDILGKIFNYVSEELAQTNEQDTKALEKIGHAWLIELENDCHKIIYYLYIILLFLFINIIN